MMSYFGLRDWKFENSNIINLSTVLQQGHKNSLEFDMGTIDWNEYFLFYLPGIKKYFFKESYSQIKESRKHYQRWVHVMLQISFTKNDSINSFIGFMLFMSL